MALIPEDIPVYERELRFEKQMREKGLVIKKMGEDGACLFRAVSDQVYGDQDMHSLVRNNCMDYIVANEDYFSQYVTEDFNHYVNRKRLAHVAGNHIEIQAISEMYNRTIEVFCYSTEPIYIFHGTPQTDNEPIRLSYHRGVHYNSLVDPFKATIGVGLGLPGHKPDLADKNSLKEASRQSEDVQLAQAMSKVKLRATDWEATNEAIEEQVARESYLQWLKDNDRRNRAARSPTESSSSATVTSATAGEMRSPRPRSNGANTNVSPIGSPSRGESSQKNSPSRLSPPPFIPSTSQTEGSNSSGAINVSNGLSTISTTNPSGSPEHAFSPPPSIPSTSQTEGSNSSGAINVSNGLSTTSTTNPSGSPEHAFKLLETVSFMNQLPPDMFGLKEWEEEDAGLLAQVLAASQQEYLDTLKRSTTSVPSDPPEDDK